MFFIRLMVLRRDAPDFFQRGNSFHGFLDADHAQAFSSLR